MSVKFFGQFLIEHGEIDAGHLEQALDHMERVNLPLGQMAMNEGLLTGVDADRVNERQREVDRPFGVLAVEMGLLSSYQLDELVQRQSRTRLPIGEALVQIGCLPAERLMALLDEYKADQSAYVAGKSALPDGLKGLRAAEVVLDFLPKFCIRVARMRLKVGGYRKVSAAPGLPHRVSVTLGGSSGLEIGLACDRDFALPLAAAMCSVDVANLDEELIDDGLGEFLNVLAGNAVGALEKENIFGALSPPCLVASLQHGWEFATASGDGEVWVVLRPV